MKTIAFIDINAGYKGAHNMGFLDVLYTYIKDTDINFSVVTHSTISKNWQNKLESRKIDVIKLFTGNFYQFANQEPPTSQIVPYIFQLSQEYTRSFEILLQKNQGIIHIIFHSMSWEHLQALSLAIKKLKDNKRLVFNIFLMYWCGIDNQKNYQNLFLTTQYKLALTSLYKQDNVNLYTSNKEYQQAISILINNAVPIHIHPFFLGNWHQSFSFTSQKKNMSNNLLLYSGEVKEDKGFFELPKIANLIIKSSNIPIHSIFIQFTKNQLNSTQNSTYQDLKQIFTKENIKAKFINYFLDTNQLNNLYKECSLILLNYNNQSYNQKTSGILWLAIQNNMTCIVSKDSWLQRELNHLGMNYYLIDDNNITQVNNIYSTQHDEYRKIIFQPFWLWLNELLSQ